MRTTCGGALALLPAHGCGIFYEIGDCVFSFSLGFSAFGELGMDLRGDFPRAAGWGWIFWGEPSGRDEGGYLLLDFPQGEAAEVANIIWDVAGDDAGFAAGEDPGGDLA